MKTNTFLRCIVFAVFCFASVSLAGPGARKSPVASATVKRKAALAQSLAQIGRPRMPATLNSGVSDSQKSLEIRGQSRNLSMLLVLKKGHENIDFVKPRESYRSEIQHTQY